MPTKPELRDAWIKALSMGHYQGCGHVRLMMEKVRKLLFESAWGCARLQFDLGCFALPSQAALWSALSRLRNLHTNTAQYAEYGLKTDDIPKNLVKAFYRYL